MWLKWEIGKTHTRKCSSFQLTGNENAFNFADTACVITIQQGSPATAMYVFTFGVIEELLVLDKL